MTFAIVRGLVFEFVLSRGFVSVGGFRFCLCAFGWCLGKIVDDLFDVCILMTLKALNIFTDDVR